MFNEAYKGDVSKLFIETYQGNVFKLAVTDNAVDVDVPGAVATYSSSNYGPEDPNNNCVESMTGTERMEDNTKRLAVITIASEGGPGGIAKKYVPGTFARGR
jgi:hypothetical protein